MPGKELVEVIGNREPDEGLLRSRINLEVDDLGRPKYRTEAEVEAEFQRRRGGVGSDISEPESEPEVIEGKFVEISARGDEEVKKSETPPKWERTLGAANVPGVRGRDALLKSARRQAQAALDLEDDVAEMTRIAGAISAIDEGLVPPIPGAVAPVVVEPTAVVENPNRAKLREERSLRQYLRESAIDIIRVSEEDHDLTLKSVKDKIILLLGYDPKTYVPADLFGETRVDRREIIQKEVEAEIEARCNLKRAVLKEGEFKSGEFGVATTDYVNNLLGRKFIGAEVSNETLLWLGQTLMNTETLVGGVGTDRALTRQDVDTGFQLYHLLGATVEQFRVGFDEDNGEKKKLFQWDDKKDEPAKVQGKKILTAGGVDKLRSALETMSLHDELFDLVKTAIENGASLYAKGNAFTLESIIEVVGDHLGRDATNLAWQLFEGLRCEALYFSGHYLGGLTLYAQSRNFLALAFDSWGGSKHGKIAVFNKDGVWVDSEGKRGSTSKEINIPSGIELTPGGNPPEGTVAPMKNAFLDELKSVAPAPLSQNVKYGAIEDKPVLLEWARSGEFLQRFPGIKEAFGASSIEAASSSAIKAGYDFKEEVKKLGGIYEQSDKAGQVDEVMKILTTIKKKGRTLVLVQKAFMQAELKTQMDRLVDDALWELGVNNIFNISGSQTVDKPRFLKPSGYNKLFEKFAVIPSSGVPLIETDTDLNKLRGKVDVFRKLSLRELKEIAGINASEDEKKILSSEEKALKMVLPSHLGDKVMSSADKFVTSFDNVLAKTLGQR